MRLRLSEICRMLAVQPPASDREVSGYSIDSRTLAPGDLFIAIRGPRFDGHQFIEMAFQAGAVAAVADSEWASKRSVGGEILAVADPAEALRSLAHQARRRWNRPVVGITGSNGKTTTKEAVSALLETRYRVSKTEGNFNNELGVPLSLLRFDDAADIGVVEMGMNHAGEIRRLAAIAEPAAGVVTNVNPAHLANFSSVEDIGRAKRELIESLPPQGTAVLNADDERVRRFADIHPGRSVTFGLDQPADFMAAEIRLMGARGAAFTLRRREAAGARRDVAFTSPLPGRHNISNVLAALAVASIFDLEPAGLVDAVSRLRAPSMRGTVQEIGGILVWNDCYNANPRAMLAMLEVLRETSARRRWAVLGEMLELGPESPGLHREVGRAAAAGGVDILVGVQGHGREMVEEAVRNGFPAQSSYFFETAAEAGEFLAAELAAGDAVLLKASRGVGLEAALFAVERQVVPS